MTNAGAGTGLRAGGVVGDGRYRLLAQFGVDRRANAHFWRARDGQLNRDVALTVLAGDLADQAAAGAAGRTLERAMHAATFAHPGVARVLDVLNIGGGVVPGEGLLGIVVAEWTQGTDLIDVVADGPVPAATASRLLEPLASAVESAHHVGLVLGVDHPQRVRVTPDGALRLAFPGPLPMATLRDDVKGLGALLYLLLTGRWALTAGPETIPGAPTGPDGTVVAPNLLRPLVPAELSSVAVRSMEDTAVGGIRTSAAILQVLDRVMEAEAATAMFDRVSDHGPGEPGAPAEPDDAVWTTRKPVTGRTHRRKLGVSMIILAVATLAIVVWMVTSIIGFFAGSSSSSAVGPTAVTTTTTQVAATTTPSTPASTSVAAAIPATPASVKVYTESGTADNAGKVGRVNDGDPGTVWKTDLYKKNFPALKSGVGIMATFGQPTKLAEVDIDSPSQGTVVEIRTAASATPNLADTQVVGQATLTNGHTVIQLNQGQPSQYVLVWITSLAADGSSYESGIAQISYVAAQ
ncbi:MAG TPA: protein kinase family protein [Pseudonocardiaceae bacterium]|jgi:hypothetical protein|nr:protein kinase family protein [Pseudonocardiaceae bacterium]